MSLEQVFSHKLLTKIKNQVILIKNKIYLFDFKGHFLKI